jgi:hypothetical protein
MVSRIITVTQEELPAPAPLPTGPTLRRNQLILDRGDGRRWSPPPTARQLTAADPIASAPGPVGKGAFAWWTGWRLGGTREN